MFFFVARSAKTFPVFNIRLYDKNSNPFLEVPVSNMESGRIGVSIFRLEFGTVPTVLYLFVLVVGGFLLVLRFPPPIKLTAPI
jgi:hypothetical protein